MHFCFSTVVHFHLRLSCAVTTNDLIMKITYCHQFDCHVFARMSQSISCASLVHMYVLPNGFRFQHFTHSTIHFTIAIGWACICISFRVCLRLQCITVTYIHIYVQDIECNWCSHVIPSYKWLELSTFRNVYGWYYVNEEKQPKCNHHQNNGKNGKQPKQKRKCTTRSRMWSFKNLMKCITDIHNSNQSSFLSPLNEKEKKKEIRDGKFWKKTNKKERHAHTKSTERILKR